VIICLCLGVSEREFLQAVRAGASTPEGVMAACGAGGDCGACRVMVSDVIAECETAAPSAGVHAHMRAGLGVAQQMREVD
jgi:bacterioferritin-associated ferredoxin